MRAIRYLWAAPASAVGLILGLVGLVAGGRLSVHTGVVEIEGRWLAWGLKHLTLLPGGADAITFGHVVLALLRATRVHERVHVHQYERWGPLFIPLYVAASAWAFGSGAIRIATTRSNATRSTPKRPLPADAGQELGEVAHGQIR